MKRALATWFGLVTVTLAWLPATAADLSPRYYGQPVAPVAPVYYPLNWTGFYLGINGGGGWGQSQWDGLNRFNISGGLIGATIGYNWQFNRIVIGAEGDIVGFSTTCPHKGFPLSYSAADRTMNCPGHYSRFDCEAGGQQIWGQATQNLPQYVLRVDDKGDIYAEGVDELLYGRLSNVL